MSGIVSRRVYPRHTAEIDCSDVSGAGSAVGAAASASSVALAAASAAHLASCSLCARILPCSGVSLILGMEEVVREKRSSSE